MIENYTSLHVKYRLFGIPMSMHRNIIPHYNQQDATFHGLFISKDALHVSGGSSAHHQEHITVHRKAKQSNPTRGLVAFGVSGRTLGLDTRHMKVVRSSPLRTGRLYPQEYPGTHF
jgi:hypothetical protein